MAERHRRHTSAFTVAVIGAALALAAPAMADPSDPAPTPVVYPTDAPPPPPPMVSSNPMTPHQPPVPAAAAPAPAAPAPAPAAPTDPAAGAPAPAVPAGPAPVDPGTAPPAVAPMTHGSVPEIPNAHYGSGNGGGGILSSIMDIWHQAKNPFMDTGDMAGGAPAPPPGAGPAPKLPPGYVSTNAPGSETPATVPAAGSGADRPALPPGYYPISGPPPPWYLNPAAAPAAPDPAS